MNSLLMKVLEDLAFRILIVHYLLGRLVKLMLPLIGTEVLVLADLKIDFQGKLNIIKVNIKRLIHKFLKFDLIFRRNEDGGVDNDSANSRDALIEEPKSGVKRRYSNASQSSREFSDLENLFKDKQDKSKNIDDPLNVGSIVGIDQLFEGGDCTIESRINKGKF